MAPTTEQTIKHLFRGSKVKRTTELEAAGLYRVKIAQAVNAGLLEKVGRGLYQRPESDISENHSVVLAAKKSPKAVMCLLTALRLHKLGTQMPHEVWVSLPKSNWTPNFEDLPVRVVWMSGHALTWGVETQEIEGVEVKIYSAAKTIADCFKFRNQIGLDVAIEALKQAREERRCSIHEIMEAARVCRVSKVITPYLEAMV